jgi:hypothetical protein
MARWYEPDDKQLADWKEWKETLPETARKNAEKFPPWELLWLPTSDSGHRVFPYSYSDNGTLTVVVTGQFNRVTMERKVFGINPEDLTPCELPGPDEPLGVTLNEEQQLAMVNRIRVQNGLPPLESLDEVRGQDGCAIGTEKPKGSHDH